MRPITINYSAPATSGSSFTTDPVALDPYTNPQSVSMIASTATGTGTLSLQVSNDDPFAPNFDPGAATWLTIENAFSSGGALTSTNPVEAVLTSVPRMVRFNASACVGCPNVFFKIVQGGIGGV